ncbi:MAG: YggT family protein [Gammaproteobacteria bacterium]
MNAVRFIVSSLLTLYVVTYILRFLMQAVRADFRNPIAQFIVRVTDPILKPLRRIIPGWRGWDLSSILVALLLEIGAVLLLSLMVPPGMGDIGIADQIVYGIARLAVLILNVYLFLILVRVILSWINPGTYSPVTAVIWSLTEPVMAPVRKLIRPIGGLDLSPLFLLIGIGALRILIQLPWYLA